MAVRGGEQGTGGAGEGLTDGVDCLCNLELTRFCGGCLHSDYAWIRLQCFCSVGKALHTKKAVRGGEPGAAGRRWLTNEADSVQSITFNFEACLVTMDQVMAMITCENNSSKQPCCKLPFPSTVSSLEQHSRRHLEAEKNRRILRQFARFQTGERGGGGGSEQPRQISNQSRSYT